MGDTRCWTLRDIVLLLLFVIVVVEGIFPREIVVIVGLLENFFLFFCIQICVLSSFRRYILTPVYFFFFRILKHDSRDYLSLFSRLVFFFISENFFFFLVLWNISFFLKFFFWYITRIYLFIITSIFFFFILVLQILLNFCWILFVVNQNQIASLVKEFYFKMYSKKHRYNNI